MRRAFTLIELLVVVAILAILATLGVVNFLEAMTRSKVSRAKSDMRTLASGVEIYAVDRSTYPNWTNLLALSTPVAYLSAVPEDVFGNRSGIHYLGLFNARKMSEQAELETWGVDNSTPEQRSRLAEHNWFIWSNGPDAVDTTLKDTQKAFDNIVNAPGADQGIFYDATNGTVSPGDLIRSPKLANR